MEIKRKMPQVESYVITLTPEEASKLRAVLGYMASEFFHDDQPYDKLVREFCEKFWHKIIRLDIPLNRKVWEACLSKLAQKE